MGLSIYVTLLALATQYVVYAEELTVDREAEDDDGKASIDSLIKEHADYAAIEAILAKQPEKQDECNTQKEEYANTLETYLASKEKTLDSVTSIKVSSEKYPLPVIQKGTPCVQTAASDASLYWFSKDVMNDVLAKAKAAHENPDEALKQFTNTEQFKTVLSNINYLQEQENVKDILQRGKDLNQMKDDWLKSLTFNIPGLTSLTGSKSSKSEEKAEE